ncbi:hypothetical protein EMQ25_02160 [Arsenicitalea aurantiaca]|uniref:Integrase catalytic domain-containing protein n=1 Tax=Arsenicitalea aurantiaca TaxID=1783274 RepID=A0A433XL33_9HYPH|nr:hypothetical protein EMQ25_02160 [Arsenicitalea aurantiaca]
MARSSPVGDPALIQGLANRLAYIAPRKPMQNGFIETFNSSFGDECRNEMLFA